MKGRKESDIQKAILDYLHLRGIFAWRMKNEGTWDAARGVRRGGTGTRGLPDIGGVLPGGRALLIEVKSERGRLSPEQSAFLDRAALAGAFACEARSIEDVAKAMRDERRAGADLHGEDMAEYGRLRK
jgi:hypothetical protein